MTKEQWQRSLQTKKLQLPFWDRLSHFGIVFFTLFIPLANLSLYLKGIIYKSPKAFTDDTLYITIIPTIVAFAFYKIQSAKLKFKEIETSLSRQQLNDIIEKVSTELEWDQVKNNKHIIVAKTHPPLLSGSWGEQITILFDKNKVLLNSICDPDKRSSVVSMGRNKQNVNKLIEEINSASR